MKTTTMQTTTTMKTTSTKTMTRVGIRTFHGFGILIIDVCVKVELVDHYVMRPMICGNEEEQLAYWESKCSSCNVM